MALTPLNIGHLLGKAKNRIYRVGVELEGGWRKLPVGVQLAHDGSVQVYDDDPRDPPVPSVKVRSLHVGELQSEPLESGKFSAWMKQYYPQKVNDTCGLHVHMSFRSAHHYQMLMIPEFQLTMLTYIRKWAENEALPPDHPVWPRLNGASEHCQHKFFPDLQAKVQRKDYDRVHEGHRYTAVNYCYSLHSTMECRLLPMMETSAQGIRAVQQVLDVTNACLRALAKREEKLRVSVNIPDGDGVEVDERKIYV